jgi:hypothetical protein
MVKDEMKDQIPLFEIFQDEKAVKSAMERSPGTRNTEESVPAVATQPKRKTSPARSAAGKEKDRAPVRPSRQKGGPVKQVPGPVPDGDVRLTANIREDLHMKLKIVAATRRTTIGELIEELVEHYLK